MVGSVSRVLHQHKFREVTISCGYFGIDLTDRTAKVAVHSIQNVELLYAISAVSSHVKKVPWVDGNLYGIGVVRSFFPWHRT